MSDTNLEKLPTEMLYSIFDYLSAHHILQAFGDLNALFNARLSAYHGYQFHFKSLSRAQFDLVHQRVDPSQVVSLTISDLEDTPGLSQLFLRCFQMTDFSQLRRLKLIDLESESWTKLLPYLHMFSQQLCIELRHGNRLPSVQVLFYATRIKIDILDNLLVYYVAIRRRITISDYLLFLQCLTVSRCSVIQLKLISAVAPFLRSLNVESLLLQPHEELALHGQKLRRLALACHNASVSMNQLERLLLSSQQLKYLRISAQGSLDLADGHLWARLANSLTTFHFNFSIEISHTEEVLESFRTSFWIEEKKWFVACTPHRLFSIPYFFDKTADAHFQFPSEMTMAQTDRNSLLASIQHFIRNAPSSSHQNYFPAVKTVEITNANSLEDLPSVINLDPVEKMILSTLINHSAISLLIESLHSLQQLSINIKLNQFLDQTNHLSFPHIRVLEINSPIISKDYYAIERLVRLFPKVEILRLNCIHWLASIPRLLDKFDNLSSASFAVKKKPMPATNVDILSTIRERMQGGNYEAVHSRRRPISTTDPNQGDYYDFWMKKQKRQQPSNRYQLPSRGYNYYRLDHYIENNIVIRMLMFIIGFAEVDFAMISSLYNLSARWHMAPIQVFILYTLYYVQKHYRDPLIIKSTHFLRCFLFIMINYMLNPNWRFLSFYGHVYHFLRDLWTFILDYDSSYFVYKFCVTVGLCILSWLTNFILKECFSTVRRVLRV